MLKNGVLGRAAVLLSQGKFAYFYLFFNIFTLDIFTDSSNFSLQTTNKKRHCLQLLTVSVNCQIFQINSPIMEV